MHVIYSFTVIGLKCTCIGAEFSLLVVTNKAKAGLVGNSKQYKMEVGG